MFTKQLAGFLTDLLEVVVFSVAIFLFVYLLILQPHKIKGTSMEPNFPDGEYLLTDKVTFRVRDPKRGDVIVFEAPDAPGEEYIKRIIGLPGEKVHLSNGNVYINDEKLDEHYLVSNLPTTAGIFLPDNQDIIVPNSNYFVLGDNRPASSDSRTWGFVAKDKISGRAWLIYWPLSKVGLVQSISY